MAPNETPVDILRRVDVRVAELHALLEEFRPLLEAFRGTNGGTVGLMRARNAARAWWDGQALAKETKGIRRGR
jgi:hypothetical protein